MEKKTNIKLISLDEQIFDVSPKVAGMSAKILAEAAGDDPITLPNINGRILAKVIEYCEHYTKREVSEDSISLWDAQFCAKLDQKDLFYLILAANELDIPPLVRLTCKIVASLIKGKTVEEIRKTFNITNDFTPEEEEQAKKENDCEWDDIW